MKQEDLIVGAWYKLSSGKSSLYEEDKVWYMKFSIIIDEYVKASEYIQGNIFYSEGGNFGKIKEYIYTLIDLSEIFDYLPDGHPDKVIKTSFVEDLTYLIPVLDKYNIK